ncbi:MAG: helix-turn-helix transcriptional regulator [Lachnospiraceae bacterium]|nr:helix-turn-helix transcriptional regulator [Lachnospiraceae bacterium]
MNERLKLLRKKLGLSQEAFGSRLGVTGPGISKIESGDRNLTEQMTLSIIREFSVNENWLRNGTGGDDNMFVKVTPQEKAYNRFGYIMENSSPTKKAALSVLLELLYSIPDEQWDMIMKQFDEIKKEG